MKDREIDDLVLAAAGLKEGDQAAVMGIMRANGQIVVYNVGSPRGRAMIWRMMGQYTGCSAAGTVTLTGRGGK